MGCGGWGHRPCSCRRHCGPRHNNTWADHSEPSDLRSNNPRRADDSSNGGDHHDGELFEQLAVALDSSWHPGALLPSGALCRIGIDAGREKEEEKIEGHSRQPACTRPRGGAYRGGAAGVIAHGSTIVGAHATIVGAHDRSDNGGNGSDGPNGHAHDGRDSRPNDANGCSYSNVSDACDAGHGWVRNASASSNGWWRLRDTGVATHI